MNLFTGCPAVAWRLRVRLRRTAVCLLMAFTAGPAAVPLRAQEEGLTTWPKLEAAAEARDYKEKIKNGGGIDAKAREFLEQTALPQLALEGNRGSIASVRKRMREFLLNDVADDKNGDEANRIFATFLETLAANGDEPPVVRVNAMLLVGELQTTAASGRKPWPGAVAALAKATANAELPKEVRIAAAAGLARHFDAAKGSQDSIGRIAKDAKAPLVAVIGEMAAAGAGPENDWLVSRCLSMLAVLGPADADAAAAVVKVIDASQRSFDARVRAATTLANIAGPQSKIDGAATVTMLETLAVAALEHDSRTAERLKLEKLLGEGGLGGPGMMPGSMGPGGPMAPPSPGFSPTGDVGMAGGFGGPGGMIGAAPPEQLIPREVCRRAAWRLFSLANAILSVDGQKGLAKLAGDDVSAAKKIAENLRGASLRLDANPVDASLLQALADLKPAPPPSAEKPAADADGEAPAAEKPPA